MRIRIRTGSEGVYDGVALAHLIPGMVYDVSPSLGRFLIQTGLAEEMQLRTSTRTNARDNEELYSHMGGLTIDQAADRSSSSGARRARRRKEESE